MGLFEVKMASKIKIDCLVKDELLYELKLRNVTCADNDLTIDLRKKLRKAINHNTESSVVNLSGKIKVSDELELLNCKVNQCVETGNEISVESRPVDIAKLETKIEHCRTRLNNLAKFKLSDIHKGEVETLMKSLKIANDCLESLNYDRDILNKTLSVINASHLEDENLSEELITGHLRE